MAAKQLLFDEAARQAVLRGVSKLSKAVTATLGPKGRNVVIDKKFGSPTVTKDFIRIPSRKLQMPEWKVRLPAAMWQTCARLHWY